MKKTDFDDKLRNLNKNVSSNKVKYVVVEDDIKNYKIK